MPLSSRQRKHLRSLAQRLEPSIWVGDAGVSDGVRSALAEALDRHELIKVRIDVEDRGQRRNVMGQLVADQFQRQGIGTSLLLASAREAGRRDFEELAMTVHPDNPAVLRLVYAAGLRAHVGMQDGLTHISASLDGVRRNEPRRRPAAVAG